MNAVQVMDRYWKEVIQVSTYKNDIKFQSLYDIGINQFTERSRLEQYFKGVRGREGILKTDVICLVEN